MIREYAEIVCWKNVSSFCSAKATHIFSAKNIIILYIESAKTVNEMTLNELVKLTMLWTTGPWLSAYNHLIVLDLSALSNSPVECVRLCRMTGVYAFYNYSWFTVTVQFCKGYRQTDWQLSWAEPCMIWTFTLCICLEETF